MKKLFTSVMLAMLGITGMNAQTTLIDYPTSKDGTAISGTTAEGTVKIHTNTDAVACYSLKNGYTSDGAMNGNHIKLTTEGGFKAGDVITIAGAINNSDETKRGTAALFSSEDEQKATVIYKFADFINGRLVADDPAEQTYTLEADYAQLYLGRDGNTGTNLTLIKVERPAQAAQGIVFDFQNNNGSWPVGEGANFADGNVSALTMNGVTLTGVQGSSANPPRIMKNNSRGICLWLYKNTSIVLDAPEGKAITKVEFTMQSGNFDITPSTGELAENVWTGNATQVTFGPNANSTRYVWAMTITLSDENNETVKPAAFDVEAANIAAFNAVEDGKIVKLTLDKARVNGYFDLSGAYYVEDASGATVVRGVTLQPGTELNGFIVGTKASEDVDYINVPSVAFEYSLTATDASTFKAEQTTLAGTQATIADVCTQAAYGKLVTLKDVTISGSGQNKTLTDGEGKTMKARDYMGVLPAEYTWPEKATITGIVIYYMTGWFILPISADAIVEESAANATVTFNFTDPNFRNPIGESMTDTKGYIYNEIFLVDDVTLQVTAGSAPSRIYVDANRGQNLVTYKDYTTLTFRAPEGKAITKIEFTAAGNSNINNFKASSGTIEGMTWTGNADGVRFQQGGTSYLANAIVTLADKGAETAALPAIEYTECANIAAFNALEAGTYAKVTLTDAEVIGVSADGYSTVWIQDATGGCWLQYTSWNGLLSEKTKINGYICAVKRFTAGNPQMKEAEATVMNTPSTDGIDSYTIVEGTLAEVNVAANLNKVVKITGATLEETSATAGKLTQGDSSIDVNNGTETANQQLHKIADWAKDTKLENVTIVAILVAKSASANQLLPISINVVTTGIANMEANETNAAIYNLQGVRLNKLQKGLNIVNGRKVVY
ncbi:MAG: hypothetical protein K6G08_07195 [Prevotella sp.]|nr:hypothetical protein [Prevotella sp.]